MTEEKFNILITMTVTAILVVLASMFSSHLSEGAQAFIKCILCIVVLMSFFGAVIAISRLVMPKEQADKVAGYIITYVIFGLMIFGAVKMIQGEIYIFTELNDDSCNNNCTDVNDPPANSPGYHSVDSDGDGTDDYIRSNPDNTTTNNINQ